MCSAIGGLVHSVALDKAHEMLVNKDLIAIVPPGVSRRLYVVLLPCTFHNSEGCET